MHVSLNIERDKINVIHPGIDIYGDFISNADERRIKKIVKGKFPVITTLARVEKRKGHKFILNSLLEVKKDFPEIIYLIAGKGPYLEEIKSYSRKLGLQNHIYFLGWITEPEKSLILKNSNLFIMTPNVVGESVEGFGMSFIDAAFHGLASIGTDSGGIADAIIDKKTGLLCITNNQQDITAKIKILLTNDQLRKQMGINGKKRAEKFFTWKNKIQEYLDIIK
jgi:phosphatidylinositol alpha-1,6-mannosyltransferase